MLVLARRPQQTIEIQVPPSARTETIIVKILDSSPSLVRLGIEAPRYVLVRREELQPLPEVETVTPPAAGSAAE